MHVKLERRTVSNTNLSEGVIPVRYSSLKSVCLCLVALMLLSVAASAVAEDFQGAYYVGFLGGENLNVHADASLGGIEDHLREGTVVQYIGSENGWLKVEWWNGDDDHRVGYVDPFYLSSITSNRSVAYRTVCGVFVHSTSKIAYGECENYHTGQKIKRGQTVAVLEQDGTWARVSFAGGSGWIPSIYLEKIG